MDGLIVGDRQLESMIDIDTLSKAAPFSLGIMTKGSVDSLKTCAVWANLENLGTLSRVLVA